MALRLVTSSVKIVQEYERGVVNPRLQEVIDRQPSDWGVKVTSIEVCDLESPSMLRAMARQAEAEREKRAKVIHAEAEFSASQHLAGVIGSQPLCKCAICSCRFLHAVQNDLDRFHLVQDVVRRLPEAGDSGQAHRAQAPH